MRDPALRPSNWRSTGTLEDELREQGVVGICGLDTRALTRHLRDRGAMRVGIFSGPSAERGRAQLLDRVRSAPSMAGAELASEVSTPTPYAVAAQGERRFVVAARGANVMPYVRGNDLRLRLASTSNLARFRDDLQAQQLPGSTAGRAPCPLPWTAANCRRQVAPIRRGGPPG